MRKRTERKVKRAVAFLLSGVIILSGMAVFGEENVYAKEEVPEPAVFMDFERGFRGENLEQAKNGEKTIGWIEKVNEDGLKPWNEEGRNTDEVEEVDYVLVENSWTADESVGHKGYTTATIPNGAKKQYLPEVSTKDGTFTWVSKWNQITGAYDENTYDSKGNVTSYGRGNVLWLENTWVNESYPTYATTVDWEAGTWTTDMNVIVRDTEGSYQEFGIDNSALIYENPFVGTAAEGMTFSAWIKNTTEYNSPVVYGKLGDLDGNDSISAEDALCVLKHVVGTSQLSETGKRYADVNGDGSVTAEDALDILKKVVGLIEDFTGTEPEPDNGEGETVVPLENSEFFHLEKYTKGEDSAEKGKIDMITERQYLYFSGDGVTYVGDFKDAESACRWILDESKAQDETVNMLNGKNGGKWNYVSYSFDGTDFHMYLNGKEVPLVKTAGNNYTNDIMSFVTDEATKSYIGGLGGGVKGNFNTYAIGTSDDYYMDDIAIYTSALSSEQEMQEYTTAQEEAEAVNNKTANVLKTYSFEGSSLAADEMTAVSGASKDYLPSVNEAGKDGKGIKLNKSYQTVTGGVQLAENPFAGKSDLTGVTLSYWIKAVGNKRGVVTDGLLLSFIDDEHECTHEKVGDNYQGANAVAKSQLYLNVAYIGQFVEGVTKPIGTRSLKNTYSYAPYVFGDPETLEDWKKPFDKGTYAEWKTLRNSLANDWNFVTVTINNAGFTMYLNGEVVENRNINYFGERFADYYWGRTEEITRKGGNNTGARSLMDFITAADTKAYIGFGYEMASSSNFLTSSECYLDELTFYDKDMNKAEVRALYEANK